MFYKKIILISTHQGTLNLFTSVKGCKEYVKNYITGNTHKYVFQQTILICVKNEIIISLSAIVVLSLLCHRSSIKLILEDQFLFL